MYDMSGGGGVLLVALLSVMRGFVVAVGSIHRGIIVTL